MQPRRRRPSIIHGRLLNRCYLARIMPLKIREPGFRKLWCFGGRIPAVSTVLFVGDERHRLLVRPTSTRNLIAFEATSWGTPRWISPSVRVMEGLGKWRERISEARLLPFRWSVWDDDCDVLISVITLDLDFSCFLAVQASLSIIFIRERSRSSARFLFDRANDSVEKKCSNLSNICYN